MSMVITNNIAAQNTTRNMNKSNNALSGSIEKLSTGYRINSGKDDPSGLVISEQLRAQKTGLERAVQNTSEATNVLSIAEGALNEMNEILKTMKSLAVHAANDGITSPEQVEADQAEMDSAIQTLERIASTTKYSDQNLLNGSKDLTYDISTEVKGTQNNQLLNAGSTQFEQIYKRDGYAVTIGFTGTTKADKSTAIGDADMTKQAAKAYMEINTTEGSLSQVDTDGNLTQSQSFILTGNKGSRQFSFAQGTNIADIVTAISNYSDSTGIDASLTFNSGQAINIATAAETITFTSLTDTAARTGLDSVSVFDNYYVDNDGEKQLIMESVTVGAELDASVVYGQNTDGQGNIYIKVTGVDTYELYKDASLSAESLVGTGDSTGMVAQNNSGLEGLTIDLNDAAKIGSVAYISVGNVGLDDASATGTGIMDSDDATTQAANAFDMSTSVASGVQLGTNTDDSGKIYIKVITDDTGASKVYAYKDSAMRQEDLVAVSEDDVDLSAGKSVTLNQVWNDEHTASTGLALQLDVEAAFGEGTHTGAIQFDNLGARIYTTDYGSDAYIQVQQFEGGLFTYYEEQDNVNSATLVDAGGTGTTVRISGQDATVNINGQQFKTNGLTLDMATSDIMAKMVFNAGKTGTTTVAQVGYGEGSVFSKNTSLTFSKVDADGTTYTGANAGFSALLNNACHNTRETVNHFTGGMQLQLGEGSGDQNRTVVAIKSMAIDNLGRISVTKQFDSGSAVIETKNLSIRDVMGGQIASLSQDPTLAMEIVEQAISDVSNLRAQIGAVQTNMLQTNQNNLEVAIENITKTESGIRDTDMASEMTAYTSSQVLSQAGVSMLSQANSNAQNVLSLLR